MIDLHSHLLPGVDDGAGSFEQAVAMGRLAAEDGCTTIVATPHLRHARYWNGDRGALEELGRRLRRRLAGVIDVRLGGEIAVHSESLDEIARLPGGDLLTLAGTRYLLLELPFQDYGLDPVEMVYELGLAGWRSIIAHPERVAWLMADPALAHALVEHGAVLQVTAMSLTGDFGPVARDAGHRLMERGLVGLVASDAHDDELRPPGLSEARRLVERNWGADAGRLLFDSHPRAVLDDQPLDAAPAEVHEARPEKASGPLAFARKLLPLGLR